MLKGLFASSSLDIANPLISFLKDRRQSNRLALTCRCHHPLNVGLILDLHLTSRLRSNFRLLPEITGFYARVHRRKLLVNQKTNKVKPAAIASALIAIAIWGASQEPIGAPKDKPAIKAIRVIPKARANRCCLRLRK